MKKVELKEGQKLCVIPGQVWQVWDREWIRVRVIREVGVFIKFLELGDFTGDCIEKKAFLRWIRRNNAKLIGMVNSKTGRVKVVK